MNRWSKKAPATMERDGDVVRIDLGKRLGRQYMGQWIEISPLDDWDFTRVIEFAEKVKDATGLEAFALGARYFVTGWHVKTHGQWLPLPADDPDVTGRLPAAVAFLLHHEIAGAIPASMRTTVREG